MTDLVRNRISVLKRSILALALTDATCQSGREDFAARYDYVVSLIDSLVVDLQKPEEEQPDYNM